MYSCSFSINTFCLVVFDVEYLVVNGTCNCWVSVLLGKRPTDARLSLLSAMLQIQYLPIFCVTTYTARWTEMFVQITRLLLLCKVATRLLVLYRTCGTTAPRSAEFLISELSSFKKCGCFSFFCLNFEFTCLAVSWLYFIITSFSVECYVVSFVHCSYRRPVLVSGNAVTSVSSSTPSNVQKGHVQHQITF